MFISCELRLILQENLPVAPFTCQLHLLVKPACLLNVKETKCLEKQGRPQSQESSTNAAAIWSLVFIAMNMQHIFLRGQRKHLNVCASALHRFAVQTADLMSGRTSTICFLWWCKCIHPTFSHGHTISTVVWLKVVPHVKVNEKIKSLFPVLTTCISRDLFHFQVMVIHKILFSKDEIKELLKKLKSSLACWEVWGLQCFQHWRGEGGGVL